VTGGAPSICLFLPLDPAERLDPADPPDDGAPSACVCLPLAAVPGREALGGAKENSPDNFSSFTRASLGVLMVISPDKVSDFTTVPQAFPVPLVAGGASGAACSVERRDPADPPDDGAPSACVCLPLAAGPGREALGGAKENSPDNFSSFTRASLGVLMVIYQDKVSVFTTMPRSVGAWLWIPPVAGCGGRRSSRWCGFRSYHSG